MARFFLGYNGAGSELWRDSKKYAYTDLRGVIPGDPAPSQGVNYKDSGVIVHWNGPKVTHKDIDQLTIDAEYHMALDWGGGAYTNGVQYEWAVGQDGTKYRLRNPGAILWHCANERHNARSFAVTFLIGEGQRPSAAAKESMAELCSGLLEIQGLGQDHLYGHRDVSQSECPGTAYTDFILPYRKGERFRKPVAVSQPVGDLYRVQTGAFANPAGAKKTADLLEAKGHKSFIVTQKKLHRVQTGAFAKKQNAENLAKELKAQGFQTVIKNDGKKPVSPTPKTLVTPKLHNPNGWKTDLSRWSGSAHAQSVVKELTTKFGVVATTYEGHGETGQYLGIDLWISKETVRANGLEEALGDAIQAHVEANWGRLRVHYCVYWGWITYTPDGWFRYNPAGYWVKNHPVTEGHYDHFHLQVYQ